MLPKLTLPQAVREDARPVQTAAMVLETALDMHRDGTLDHLLVDRPGAARWLTRIFLRPILGAAGDALPSERAMTTALTWLMEWAITQLRPDRASTLRIEERKAWLDSTSWRPMIAVMCHYGFAPTPDFKDRYYRRPNETPADNLCGLWNIGPSTYYRYLEKAKRLMARALYEQRLDRRHSQSLREFTRQRTYRLLNLTDASAQSRWHQQQIGVALKQSDALSALWHARQAGDIDQACALIQQHLAQLASRRELDAEIRALRLALQKPELEFKLGLIEADLWRTRDDVDKERDAYEQALHIAVSAGDSLMLGIVYARLGKYYEPRDPDRSFSYYQDSVEFLQRAEALSNLQSIAAVQDEYASTMARLAWLYILRNDPRAKAILEHADTVRKKLFIKDLTAAMLEQCWGEYWRRANDSAKAMEHQQRALNIYERLGDQQGLAKAYINLGLGYSELRQFDRAITYLNHVLNLSRSHELSSESIASAHLNLGGCYFWMQNYREAIAQYSLALERGLSANLSLHVMRARFNLAEAHYTLFKLEGKVEDERWGDQFVQDALSAWPAEADPAQFITTQNLKQEILAHHTPKVFDRLKSSEAAAYFAEYTELERNQAILATPAPTETHIRAHLAIANAHLAISAKAREAAIALIEQRGLVDQFATELRQLQTTFNRELTREQRLDAQWKQSAGELLDDQHRARLLAHLIANNFINKSSYATLCDVSLATASKHLGLLTTRGLLVQTGKGPATKYHPAESALIAAHSG